MEHCIGLKYSLPNTGSSIPKITVSTLSDKCYQVLTSDGDLSKIIYYGIIEYSFDESSIDLTKLDTLQKRALISRMKFDRAATEERISPLQRPHYFTSSYTYLFSKKVILLSFLG